MGPIARPARDNLVAALDDPNRSVRYAAIDALGYLGYRSAEDAAPANCLADIVSGPDTLARRHAINALGGSDRRPATPRMPWRRRRRTTPSLRSDCRRRWP